MDRKLRLDFAGACDHVRQRGNDRRDLFAQGGAESFQTYLDETGGSFGWLVDVFPILRLRAGSYSWSTETSAVISFEKCDPTATFRLGPHPSHPVV